MSNYAKIFDVPPRQRIFPVEARKRIFDVESRVRIFPVTKGLGDNAVIMPPAWGPNLLTNGDFENWAGTFPDNWSGSAGASTVNRDTVDVYHGLNAMRFDVDAGNSTIYALRSENFTIGQDCRITFAYKNEAGKTATYKFNGPTKSLDLSGDWQPGSNYYILPSSTVYILFQLEFIFEETGGHTLIFRNSNASSSSLWFDYAMIQERL